MKKIRNAFFCTTPYQLITSVVLNHLLGEVSDIYIVPQFKSAAEYADNLRYLKLFNRVKLVDITEIEEHKKARNKFLMHVGIVRQYMKIDDIAQSFLFQDTKYKKMYVSSKAYIPRMAYLYCVKHNLGTELVYYDDGEGSYYNRYRIEASPIDNFIRQMLFGKRSASISHKLYLYEPKLYKELNGSQWNGEIVPIPHIVKEQPVKDWISKIFRISSDDLISEKAIILDVLKEGKYSLEDEERLFGLYDDIQNLFGYEETIIKRHPRDKSTELNAFKCYEKYNIPFECLCTQMNMEEKVLIAVSSTAVILPKLLLGKEPIVILLYKLIDQINQSSEYKSKQDHFYKLCKGNYSSSDRFFIPKSYDELKNILESIALKSGNKELIYEQEN